MRIFQAVGSTFMDTLRNATTRDLFIYFYRHIDDQGYTDARHSHIWPMFERFAELMHTLPRAPDTFLFAKIDIGANEMMPPFETLDR